MPEPLSPFYLSAFLGSLQEQGYTVFVVSGGRAARRALRGFPEWVGVRSWDWRSLTAWLFLQQPAFLQQGPAPWQVPGCCEQRGPALRSLLPQPATLPLSIAWLPALCTLRCCTQIQGPLPRDAHPDSAAHAEGPGRWFTPAEARTAHEEAQRLKQQGFVQAGGVLGRVPGGASGGASGGAGGGCRVGTAAVMQAREGLVHCERSRGNGTAPCKQRHMHPASSGTAPLI